MPPKTILAVALCALSRADATAVTPVQKVLDMMSDMLAKGKKEKEEEVATFEAYQEFCTNTRKEKQDAIMKENEMIERFKADIANAEGEIIALSKAIAGHDADIAAWNAEYARGKEQREREHEAFKKEQSDYVSSIDSAKRAEATISSGSDVSLVEKTAALRRVAQLGSLSSSTRRAVEAFMQEKSDSEAALVNALSQTPEAEQYESHSSGVLDLVKQMGETFEDKKSEIEKEELVKANAFGLISQELVGSIKEGNRQREEKSGRSQEIAQQKAEAQSSMGQTKADLAADQQFLHDLNTECQAKATDFEKRQVLRAGEIEALSKAIEIMSSEAINAGTSHLPSLVQDAASLAQLRSVAVNVVQKNVAALLESRAQQTQSRLLSAIATRVRDDPFKKVTKMVQGMIDKLMQEAREEAEHKGFCDTELSTNKQTRDIMSDGVSELTAKSEELTANIKKFADEVADLSDEIAVIDAQVNKATKDREAEKTKNAQTIADATAGLKATTDAVGVLRDFYAGASGATALVQVRRSRVPGSPETFDKPFTGQGNEAGGVVAMLEVIESDFARLDAETRADEDAAEKSHLKYIRDASKDKAVKTTTMNNLSHKKTGAERDLLDTQKDLASTRDELHAALQYFEKLKPACVEAGVAYEQRVAKRKEEIESLKEALSILDQAPGGSQAPAA